MPKPKRFLTAEERRYIEKLIPGRSHKETALLFNTWLAGRGEPITNDFVCSYIKNHGLSTGRTGRFEKGCVPFNKGRKGLYTSEATTKFKKGHVPHNYLPVGTERVNTDGYVEIKIADPNKWRGKHLLTWEEYHGSVPKGHAVIFGDGDNRNFAIDNLILVTRAELAMLNKHHLIGASAELTKVGVTVADLIMKMTNRKKGTCNA